MTRVRKLINEDLMKPAGLAAFEETNRKPELIYDIKSVNNLPVPDDLMEALKNNIAAYNNFTNFTPASRKLYLLWLTSAKRAETRQSRIKMIVERSEKDIRAGMM
jgi:uncharacterized protein YdeI (YjbR/CyaY-like superfamily)